YPSPAVPAHIAWLAVAYSVLTWAGMILFGREVWLRHGEVFTVVFGIFARVAPIDVHPGPPCGVFALRPFGAGLRDSSTVTNATTAFVLLLLASVLYDGASTSPEWARLEAALTDAAALAPMTTKTMGLVAFWLLLGGAYVGVSALMSTLVGGRLTSL